MSLRNKRNWKKLLAFKNEKEIIEHITAVLSTSFAYEIERLLKERGMTKKDLALKIGTSASYITQVMAGDKFVNMAFLAKIKYHLGVDILVKVVDTRKQTCRVTPFPGWISTEANTKKIHKVNSDNETKAS